MKREGEEKALASAPVLPPGWASAEVGEIAEVDIGFAFKSAEFADGGIRLLRGENIEPGALRWTDTRYWPRSKLEPFRKLLVEPGDLILAMDRPVVSAGLKLARVRSEDCPCLLVQRVARLRGQDGTTDILHHALSAPGFTKHILEGGQTGTQLPHISGKRIENFKLLLPPKREQQRLAEALDSYLTRLDAAAHGLRRVEANLKRYRASVLKAAVEGRLVPTEAALAKRDGRAYETASELLARILKERRRRWEAAELAKMKAKGESPKTDTWKSKYQAPSAPDTTNLPPLPEGWCWASLGQLAWASSYGTSVRCEPDTSGCPVLRIPNVSDAKIDLRDLKFATKDLELAPGEELAEGDFVLIRTNGSRSLIGRAAFVPAPLPRKHYFASYLIRFRLSLEESLQVVGRWLSHFWHAPDTRALLEKKAATSAGQYNLSMSGLADVLVPLPPLTEIERICGTADDLHSVAESIGTTAESRAAKLARLRQSILTWAFEGKLVDQDPNDEPASVLLDRIRQERAQSATNKAEPTGTRRRRSA